MRSGESDDGREPDLERALFGARGMITTAAYALAALGVVFFIIGSFSGDRSSEPMATRLTSRAVVLLVLPIVGAIATRLISGINMRCWGDLARFSVLLFPGLLAFAPFVGDYGIGNTARLVQIVAGLFWLARYLGGARAVHNVWDAIAATPDERR